MNKKKTPNPKPSEWHGLLCLTQKYGSSSILLDIIL